MTLEVAVVCEYPTVLGGERSMLALVPRLDAEGVVLRAIVPAGKLAQAWGAIGADVVLWSAGRGRADGPCERHRAAEELESTLDRLRPRLVHANSLAMGRLTGPIAARIAIPSIAHLRDIVGLSRRAVCDLNRNDRLLAVSDAVRRFHVAQGASAANTHILYNGVDLQAFEPRARTGWLCGELGVPQETLLVGGIGQISLRKGWDVLLSVARDVLGRLPNVAFVLVGARYSEKAETRAVELALTELVNAFPRQVFWLGQRDDVPRILSELDVLAHAARQEPLGRVLLESAATGVAIAATDVGGTSEIFAPPTLPSPAAVLVRPDDAPALAGAILELLANAPRREELGRLARRRAVEAFDAAAAAAGLLRHYQDVAGVSP
jgi:glycosyltransferase involved in cell wall biosynthesis